MTLRHLAERSNLSYSFIASLEKGRYNPSRESIYSLAAPLGADVNELLKLAGFLPDNEPIERATIQQFEKEDKPFEMQNILTSSISFQGKILKDSEKIAILAFLQTMVGLNDSKKEN